MILVSTKKAEQILVHKRSFDIEHDLNYEHLTLFWIKLQKSLRTYYPILSDGHN